MCLYGFGNVVDVIGMPVIRPNFGDNNKRFCASPNALDVVQYKLKHFIKKIFTLNYFMYILSY